MILEAGEIARFLRLCEKTDIRRQPGENEKADCEEDDQKENAPSLFFYIRQICCFEREDISNCSCDKEDPNIDPCHITAQYSGISVE